LIIKYEYIKIHHLFLVKWNGQWDLNIYKKSLPNFIKMLEKEDVKFVIHDICNLDFDVKTLNINELIKIRKEKITKNYKTVYLTKAPKDVVFSHLYSMGFTNKNDFMFCRTIQKAINLLSLSISNLELTNAFTSLNKTL
jgi:hypothetical protein